MNHFFFCWLKKKMPRQKNPEALLRLCKSADYLRKNLIPSMIDNLFRSVDPLQNLTENIKLMLLKVYMHEDMNSFQPSFRLPNKDSFYELQLMDMRKLVVLNLRMVCTDEILEVIGRYCQMLEIVDIVSKIGSESNKMSRNQLNALKLKFYVSDDGLKHLHKCVKLKRITMNTVIRTNCGGRKITHNGIRELIKVLPKLQHISYSDMGFILKDFDLDNSLNLLQLHDNHTNPDHIDIFSKHCPHLKCLCLVIPTTNTDEKMPGICMDRLAKSELNLKSLALGMFPVGGNFIYYLSLKGQQLVSLCLIHKSTINLSLILTIGSYCPNLKHLEICRLIPKASEYFLSNEEGDKESFKNLVSLKIIGTCWDPCFVFPLCLFNSPFLQEIVLVNEHYYKPVDDIMISLINKNKLHSLRDISLLDGFSLNVENLIKFVLHCKELKSIRLKKGNGYEEYLCLIKEENNLDLIISTDSLRNFNECFC